MKILQVTHFGTTTNYGQVLQAYALQKVLDSMGHQTTLLRTDFDFSMSNPAWYKCSLYNAWRRLQRKKRRNKEEKLHPRHFDSFIANHLRTTPKCYYNYEELLADSWHEYDAFVVGSDQVWANWCLDGLFMLDFAPENASLTGYSVSAGKELVQSAQYHQKLLKALERFKGKVSVRDNATQNLLQSLTNTPCPLVPDPTWLLPPSEYRNTFALPEKHTDGDTCFVYLVNRESESIISSLLDFCADNKKKLRVVTSRKNILTLLKGKAEIIYPSIEEWLAEISTATLVVADSFHGAAFAINFNRNLVVPYYMSNDIRFQTLHSLFDFGNVYQKQLHSSLPQNTLDWEQVNSRKQCAVQRGMEFLKNVLP